MQCMLYKTYMLYMLDFKPLLLSRAWLVHNRDVVNTLTISRIDVNSPRSAGSERILCIFVQCYSTAEFSFVHEKTFYQSHSSVDTRTRMCTKFRGQKDCHLISNPERRRRHGVCK